MLNNLIFFSKKLKMDLEKWKVNTLHYTLIPNFELDLKAST